MTFPFQWPTCLLARFEEGPDGELVRDENTLTTLQEVQPKVSLTLLGFVPTFHQFADLFRDHSPFRNFSPKGLGSSLPIFCSHSLMTNQARNLLKYVYHAESELKSLLSNPPTLNSVIFC